MWFYFSFFSFFHFWDLKQLTSNVWDGKSALSQQDLGIGFEFFYLPRKKNVWGGRCKCDIGMKQVHISFLKKKKKKRYTFHSDQDLNFFIKKIQHKKRK